MMTANHTKSHTNVTDLSYLQEYWWATNQVKWSDALLVDRQSKCLKTLPSPLEKSGNKYERRDNLDEIRSEFGKISSDDLPITVLCHVIKGL